MYSKWDASVGKGDCYQASSSEFDPWGPHGGRSRLALTSCPPTTHRLHAHPCPHKLLRRLLLCSYASLHILPFWELCMCSTCIIFTVLILWGAFYLVKHKKSHVRRANSQWGRKPVIKWHLLWMLSVECVILCPASTANAKVGRTGLPKQVGTC